MANIPTIDCAMQQSATPMAIPVPDFNQTGWRTWRDNFTVKVGQEITIQLPSNFDDSMVISSSGDRHYADSSKVSTWSSPIVKPVKHESNSHSWTFKALEPGEELVNFLGPIVRENIAYPMVYNPYDKTPRPAFRMTRSYKSYKIRVNPWDNESLRTAAKQGDIITVQNLLAMPSINVNAQDGNGQTALHIAAYENLPIIVETLLKAPTINVNIKDNTGKTALEIAQFRGNLPIIFMLRNK